AAFLLRRAPARTHDMRHALRRVVVIISSPALVVGAAFILFAWPTIQSHALTKEYRARLALLPDDAVVMAGGQTVAVTYYRGLGLGHSDVIRTGRGWAGARLTDLVDERLPADRRAF